MRFWRRSSFSIQLSFLCLKLRAIGGLLLSNSTKHLAAVGASTMPNLQRATDYCALGDGRSSLGKRSIRSHFDNAGTNTLNSRNQTRYTLASGELATPPGGKTSGTSRRATPIR